MCICTRLQGPTKIGPPRQKAAFFGVWQPEPADASAKDTRKIDTDRKHDGRRRKLLERANTVEPHTNGCLLVGIDSHFAVDARIIGQID